MLTTAEPLEPVSGEKGHANSQIASIEACGDSAEQVLRDGIVYSIPAPVSHPGPYDMRVAVRNVPASEDAPSIGPAGLVNRPQPDVKPTMAIGSASEYVSVPDLRKTECSFGPKAFPRNRALARAKAGGRPLMAMLRFENSIRATPSITKRTCLKAAPGLATCGISRVSCW